MLYTTNNRNGNLFLQKYIQYPIHHIRVGLGNWVGLLIKAELLPVNISWFYSTNNRYSRR